MTIVDVRCHTFNADDIPVRGFLRRTKFDEEQTASFMGGAALRFLGFDDPTNKNAKRLAARYQKYAPHVTPAWLAAAPD